MNGEPRLIQTVKNMSLTARVVIISFLALFVFVVVLAIVVTNQPKMENTALVDVQNYTEESNVPVGYRRIIEQRLGDIINNSSDSVELVFSDALIRDGSYKEEKNDYITSASFIVDIEELHYSFVVKLVWPNGIGDKVPEDPSIDIECPHYLDVIYKDKKCIVGSPEYQIKRYLPHYGRTSSGEKFGVSLLKYEDVSYLMVEVAYCGNELIEEAAIAATKEWLKKIYMDPNDFTIDVVDICGEG